MHALLSKRAACVSTDQQLLFTAQVCAAHISATRQLPASASRRKWRQWCAAGAFHCKANLKFPDKRQACRLHSASQHATSNKEKSILKKFVLGSQ